MAKVYDALKRVEEERERHTRAVAAQNAAASRPSDANAPLWRRWFDGRARPALAEPAAPVDTVLLERLQMLAARLDALEQHTTTSLSSVAEMIQALDGRTTNSHDGLCQERLDALAHRLEAVEEHSLKGVTSATGVVRAIEARMVTFESNTAAKVATVTDQAIQHGSQLNTRITILLSALAVSLVALLMRC